MLSKTKAKMLAKEYIKQNFNAAATIREIEPHLNKGVARNKGARMLSNAIFNKSLQETMAEIGLNDSIVEKTHKRNLKQNKNLPASNEAINIYHKIKGNYAPEKKLSLNINIQDPQAVNKRIQDLEEELKQLNEPRPETA